MRSSFSLFLAVLTRIGLLWDAEAVLLEGLILRTEGKTRGWPEIIGLGTTYAFLRTRDRFHNWGKVRHLNGGWYRNLYTGLLRASRYESP
jgi:hypothetical protein